MRFLPAALVLLPLLAAAAAHADNPPLPGDNAGGGDASGVEVTDCIDAAKRRDADAAIALCTKALDTGHLGDAPTVAALVNRGLAHLAKNEPAPALPDFDRAIAMKPDTVAFYDMRALAHAMLGETTAAIADYAAVIGRGAPEDAGPAELLLRQGIALHLSGDESAAASLFAQALHAAPAQSEDALRAMLWQSLSLQASRQNAMPALNAEMAGRDLAQWPGPLLAYYGDRISEQALELALDDPDPTVAAVRACQTAFYVSARALIDGRFGIAKDGFEHAQSLCPPTSLEFAASRPAAVLAARPVSPDLSDEMQQCQAADANGEALPIIDLCSRALDHPDAPDVWRVGALTRRATAYERSGDLDRAIADLDAALLLRPDSVEIYRQRSAFRRSHKEGSGALADLAYALTLQPDYVPARVDRAWMRVAVGDTTGALADFTKALQVHPDQPRLHLGRGVVAYLAGDDKQAAADFIALIQAGSPAPYAVLWLALAEQRSKIEDDGALESGLAVLDLNRWPGPAVRFVRGEITADDLAAAAADPDPLTGRKRDCEASFYRGAVAQNSGDVAAARAAFQHALALCSPDNIEYHAAEAELGFR